MVMCMMDSGIMIRLMGLEFIAILTGPSTKATGKKISNMAMDWRPGLMELGIRANM